MPGPLEGIRVFDLTIFDNLPYIALFVRLAEGPMMMTNLVDSDRNDLHCEAPVEVTFVDATPEVALPEFRLSRT